MKNQNTIPEVTHNALSPRKDTDFKLMKMKYFLNIATIVCFCLTCLSFGLAVWFQGPTEETLSTLETTERAWEGLLWGRNTISLAVITVFCAIIASRIDFYCGFYRCPKCGHIYVPIEKDFTETLGLFYKRNMRCPACGKRSWNEKVLVSTEHPDEN